MRAYARYQCANVVWLDLAYTYLTEQIENDLPLYPQSVYNRRMDISYQLQGVEFEWDEEKARSNIADHGVTFEEAAEVFFDPFYQGGDASTEDEAREFIIGYSLVQRLLLAGVSGDRGSRGGETLLPQGF